MTKDLFIKILFCNFVVSKFKQTTNMKNKLFPTLLLIFFLTSFKRDSSWVEVTSEQQYEYKVEDFRLGNKFYFVKDKSLKGLKVGEYFKNTNKYSWDKKYLNKVYNKQ